MTGPCRVWAAFLGVGLWWLAAVGFAQTPPPNPNPPPPATRIAEHNDEVEVMTRGPVHEAYAEPVVRDQGAPLVVGKRPPEAIEEFPPDTKPEGDNVAWISGYWAWDEDRKDYIWVSGVWRSVPASQTWVPGYWTETDGGYRWVSGFWMPEQNQEVEYLAEPPATLEQGPSSPAPSDDYFWNPGYWEWYETRYVWRPGFWTVCQPAWIWVPAHYCWTPRGWIFIRGYWDYPLMRRGVLFAPICFRRPLVHWHTFRWSPVVVIQPSILDFHLFVRPSYGHYYFGDYYAVRYEGLGFRPWFRYHGHHGFDPLFNYYRWYHHHQMHERDWEHNIHGWFTYYRHHEHERPPHTLLAQQQLANKAKGRPDFQHLQIGKPIKELAGHKDSFVKLSAVSEDQRHKIKDASRQLGDFKKQRLDLETSHRTKPGDPKIDFAPRLKPDSKIAGKRDLPDKLPGTRKPEIKGDGKLGEAASTLSHKQPEKVRLPKKLDLGGLGANQSHGPAVIRPGTATSKLGVAEPKAAAGTRQPGIRKSDEPPSGGSTNKHFQPGRSGPSPTIRRNPGRSSYLPKSRTLSDAGEEPGLRRFDGGAAPTFRQPGPSNLKQRFDSGGSAPRPSRGPDRDDRGGRNRR